MLKLLKYTFFVSFLAVAIFSANAFAVISKPFSQRSDVSAFIDEMVKVHQFDRSTLDTLFDNITLQSDILAKMTYPAENKSWSDYSKIFLTEKRIQEGVEYWNAHEKTLNEVEKQYGVPAQIIVSILGIETNYGKTQGHYPVLDTLSTLAFNYPARSPFFKSELQQFLLLARENQFNPTTMYGSYAGAIGQPQFMPSSYRRYAIDFTQSQQKDLINSAEDSIASIANFLKVHGWLPKQGIASQAVVSNMPQQQFLQKTQHPQYSVETLEQYGITPQQKISPSTKATLIALDEDTNPQYWLGFENFYVIMHYNPRVNYAMAVYQLSEMIRNQKTQVI